MILPVVILIVSLATVFTALALIKGGIIQTVLAIVTWLAACASSIVIEVPYQIYHEAENTVVTGTQKFASAESMLAWLFFGFAIIMVLYLWVQVTEAGAREIGRLK